MLLNILTSFWKVFLLSVHLCHANHPAEEFCPHPKYAPRERDLLISAWEALVPFSILGQKAARKGLSHWAMDFPELQSWEGLQHPVANPWQINLIYLTRVQKVLSHPQQPSWCPREEGTILHVSKQCNSPSLQTSDLCSFPEVLHKVQTVWAKPKCLRNPSNGMRKKENCKKVLDISE